MAQEEASQTSERTLHAMRALKAKGVVCGAHPYGKEYFDRLDSEGRKGVVENPAKLATIVRIRELHAQGKGIKARWTFGFDPCSRSTYIARVVHARYTRCDPLTKAFER